jgi:hypothetical protein
MTINNCFGFSTKIYFKNIFVSFLLLTSIFMMQQNIKSPANINCAVNKSKQFTILKIRIFTRMSMPQLRQNDREQGVGMVQAGMTHQALADHFNVSRITIPMLMIRLRQTDRTNDRPRNGRPRVTSQRQDRHLRLIHLRNRSATVMTNSSPDHNKTVGLVHTLVRKTFSTPVVHMLTSIGKTK